MSTKWVGVLGTWAFKPHDPRREWWQSGSTFDTSLQAKGFEIARPDDEFVWSGDLDGTFWARGNDWEAGAVNFAHYLRELPPADRNVIAHSHGGAVTLLAAVDVPIRTLVTLGTPARKAVRAAARTALQKGHLGAWAHVTDDTWDTWGQFGALFDGEFRLKRTMDLDGCRDVRLHGIGHSKLLDGSRSDVWERAGLLTLLREATCPA